MFLAFGHESFSDAYLRRIIAGNQADQDVGINGQHAAVEYICECRPLRRAGL
jgi:hypothetical protein